jgi:pimeloyl-ACP methyl ester carboxylesterase
MTGIASTRRRRLYTVVALVVAILLGSALPTPNAHADDRHHQKPTIVFVHGAFADASGFSDSIANLHRRGYTVYAPPNPLRHSYGGAVITNAATGNPNIKALVYIAAFALDEGESVDAATHLGGGSTDLIANIEFRPYPGAPDLPPPFTGKDMDAYIKQAAFRQIFAADVPAPKAAVMAATQRPATLLTLGLPSGVPAWKTIPSWYLVARNDKAIPMVSQPQDVTAVVLAAANARRGRLPRAWPESGRARGNRRRSAPTAHSIFWYGGSGKYARVMGQLQLGLLLTTWR